MDEDVPWPRGFPLNRIVESSEQTHAITMLDSQVLRASKGVFKVGQVQSLANHDPDMDAIYRLTRKLPLTFSESVKTPKLAAGFKNLLLQPQVAAPCNAQASLHFALWDLLLPVTVHGRVSDIWRSYWAQALYWRSGYGIAFANLKVVQVRNAHGYLADLSSEIPLYKQSGALVDFIKQWAASQLPTGDPFSEAMIDLTIGMYEREYIETEDVELMIAWVASLQMLNLGFPSLK